MTDVIGSNNNRAPAVFPADPALKKGDRDWEAYRQFAHENGGIAMFGGNGTFIVTDTEVAKQILADLDEFATSPFERTMFKVSRMGTGSIVAIEDNKVHDERKKELREFFNGRQIASKRPAIQAVIKAELDKIETPESIDIIELMKVLTIKILCSVILEMEIDSREVEDMIGYMKRMETNLGKLFEKDMLKLPSLIASIFAIRGFLKTKLDDVERNPERYSEDSVLKYIATSENYSSKAQRIDELLIFFYAGHETTATTLSWIFYHLLRENESKNNSSDTTLNVLKEAIDAHDHRSIGLIVKGIALEVMRITPAIGGVYRVAAKDMVIVDKNGREVLIPKGSNVKVDTKTINRNLQPGKDDSFDPSDIIFDAQLQRQISSKQTTFGGGDKFCIGYDLAMEEIYQVLIEILKRYNTKFREPGTYAQIKETIVQALSLSELMVDLEIDSEEVNRTLE